MLITIIDNKIIVYYVAELSLDLDEITESISIVRWKLNILLFHKRKNIKDQFMFEGTHQFKIPKITPKRSSGSFEMSGGN